MSIRNPTELEKHFGNIPLEHIIRNNILDKNENNVLHAAIVFNDVNKYYISQLEIFNHSKNNKGNTPLHLACAKGDSVFLYYLIHKYALNIYETNNKGYNLLDVAIIFKQKDIINILIKYYYTEDKRIFKSINEEICNLQYLKEAFNEKEIEYISKCFTKDNLSLI